MISFTSEQTYHLYTKAVDMRKDIDSLCGLIREEMGEDPNRVNHVYLFFQKGLKMAKILYRGYGRYEMLKIRLDDGKFFRPTISEDRLSGKISWSDFVALTEGVSQRDIAIKYLDSAV